MAVSRRAKKNSSSFSNGSRKFVGSGAKGICPLYGSKYVFGFQRGGHYEHVECLGSRCALWSLKYCKCKLALVEDLFDLFSVLP